MKTIFYCGLFAGLVSINAVQMRAHHERAWYTTLRCGAGFHIEYYCEAGRLRASLMRGGAVAGQRYQPAQGSSRYAA